MTPTLRGRRAGPPSPRRATVVAAVIAVLLVTPLTVSLIALNGGARLDALGFTAVGVSWTVVGALIVFARERNVVGLLLVFGGLSAALSQFSGRYADFAQAHPELPPADLIQSGAGLGWFGMVTSGLLLFQLYPSGNPLGPRWRALMITTLLWLVAYPVSILALESFVGGQTLSGQSLERSLERAQQQLSWPDPGFLVFVVTGYVLTPTVFVILGASVWSLAVRYRRSRGDERLQMMWLMYVAALLVVPLVLLSRVAAWPTALGTPFEPFVRIVQDVIMAAGVPVAIMIAVLRYRLYDIDVLINRTIVYGTVTATLLGTYAVAVLVFRQLFGQFVTGNDLVVAASTLLVAGLFQQVRRRVQEIVDRRFYRRKYDAGKMIATFSARLRQEVDLDSVTRELTRVASDAVQPTHASLWLRRGEERR